MRAALREYCSESTIHGVRYFTERERHWTERFSTSSNNYFLFAPRFPSFSSNVPISWIRNRFCWILAFLISVSVCSLSMHKIWTDWVENPMILGFSDEPASISSIPFPVTNFSVRNTVLSWNLRLVICPVSSPFRRLHFAPMWKRWPITWICPLCIQIYK